MTAPANSFIAGSIPRVLARTALPIIFLTSLNGLLTVVDAILLGAFVGPDALAAVTLMFPLVMLLSALATMVSSGMASVLARQLGAGHLVEARASFAGAHGLLLAVYVIVLALFAVVGRPLVDLVAGGEPHLAEMAWQFLAITVFTSPLLLLVSVHSDGLRVEGRIGFMALGGVVVTLGNMVFNVAFIAWAGMGVAGSAWGSALAQAVAVAAILAYRQAGKAQIRLGIADLRSWREGWSEMLALGAPRSLSFIGIALGSAATILALRLHADGGQGETVAAYGVITRIMTFAYLPLLGMSLAMQAVVGNNYGAGLWERSNAALKLTMVYALVYSTVVEVVLLVGRESVGAIFVSEPAVIAEIGRIVPFYVMFYFTLGPMMMIASYLQSIGDARRSALLSLARTYLFAVPLTFLLPPIMGETGIWLAYPAADFLLVVVTGLVLFGQSRQFSWGLFKTA